MFSGKDIDEIVLFVDNEISKYATFFDLEKKEFDSLTNNASYLANERTVSFFANEKLKEYLDSNGYKVALYANEFSIKITNGINRSVFNTLISEVVQSKQLWFYVQRPIFRRGAGRSSSWRCLASRHHPFLPQCERNLRSLC